jgi:hypothetical protein
LNKIDAQLYFLKTIYKLEDFTFRSLREYPTRERKDSYPFLSCDTFSLSSDYSIDKVEDAIKLLQGDENSVIYLNGSLLPESAAILLKNLSDMETTYAKLLIGDSDFCPSSNILWQFKEYFNEIWSVNLRITVSDKVHFLPLGLESARYRSAGQVRDFIKVPKYDPNFRDIELLVAWNDETWLMERKNLREILRLNPVTFEIRKRETSRYIHQLMRRAKIVPCPRGNGLDTHRFWESLYLGALPVLLKRDLLPGLEYWPHITVQDWEEILDWDKKRILEIYLEKIPELIEFRNQAKLMLDTICLK